MAGLFYLFIPITHTSFASFNSLYVKKKQYFDQEKRDRASKNVMQAESARDLLGAATRVRESAVTESYKTLSSKKAKGKIAALVADPILRRTASSEGWLAQSNHILQNGVSTSQYLELEGAITAIERQHGGSTMTAGYGNLSEDRAAIQRSRNTRIVDLPSSDERRGIEGTSRESPRPARRTRYPPFSVTDTPEFMRRERKAKVGRVMTRALMKMIDQSVPRAERNKAFVVQDKLAMGNTAYVGTVVNLMPTMLGTQELLEACMMQASFELYNRN